MTVKDETTPTIAAVNPTVTATSIGNCRYTVPNLTTDSYVTVSDECTTQALRVSQDVAAGTQFNDNETSKDVVVTVTDGCGKSANVTITVQKPAAVSVRIEPDAAGVCQGGSVNLTATATSGNSGNISYAWSPNTGLNATNVANVTATPATTTTYTVTATDGMGCSNEASVTVTAYPLPSVSIADVVDQCPNGDDVYLFATATLGENDNEGFEYSWSCSDPALLTYSSSFRATLSNIPNTCAATTYTVTVVATETGHGCSATASNTVTVKDDEVPTILSDVSSILAVVSGSTESCVYQMPNLINNENIHYTITDNCSSQNYLFGHLTQSVAEGTPISANQLVTVTVADSCGRTASVSITVTVPQASINLVTGNHTNVKCPGGSDGVIQILPQNTTGGLRPYRYKVDDGEYVENITSSLYDFTNLTAGTHILTVMDSSGCTASQEVILSQPDPWNLTISTDSATCSNKDGKVIVSVEGGTPMSGDMYLFKLTSHTGTSSFEPRSSLQTSPYTFNELPRDLYDIVIIGQNNCSIEDTFSIKLKENLVIDSIERPDPICSGGQISVRVYTSTPGTVNPSTTYLTWNEPTQIPANGVLNATASDPNVQYTTVDGTNLENVTPDHVPVVLNYSVTAHNGVCHYTFPVEMTVSATVRPQVNITTHDYEVCPNEGTVTLSAEIANVYSEKDTLTWTFNNGTPIEMYHNNNTSNSYAETKTFDIPDGCSGNYTYHVAYTDGVCTNSSAGHVIVRVDGDIVIVSPASTEMTVDCPSSIVAPHEDAAHKMPVSVKDGCGQDIASYSSWTVDPATTPSCSGDVSYIYTYKDCNDPAHTATYTYTYHIVVPELTTVPEYGASVVHCVNQAVKPANPGMIQDACGRGVTATYADSTGNINVKGHGTVVHRFVYTDCSGATTDWKYTYTVVPEHFTKAADEVVTINCPSDHIAEADINKPNINVCGNHIELSLRSGYPQDVDDEGCGN